MLSILIPVYNWDIRKLTETLHRQSIAAKLNFEILCFDDGSAEKFKILNRVVSALENVNYRELPENHGRAKIRNVLGKAAKYEYLLFMDCDSGVISDDYIQRYITHLEPNTLLYGGRVYQEKTPSKDYLFHWTYGKTREQVPVGVRNTKPYHSFMTNNFLLPKKIFLHFLFDENLTQYGHEDTIFGLQLKAAKVPILHLDNPLQHEGLEKTDTFLQKSRQGLENLWYLANQYELIDTKLLSAYKSLKKYYLLPVIAAIYRLTKNQLEKNFHSEHPDLKLFDFYKLGCLIEISKTPT